jgi:hypothetical protein
MKVKLVKWQMHKNESRIMNIKMSLFKSMTVVI